MSRFIGSLRKDRRGGIEGLPLQLMIVILVATMGTAVIIGWMGNIETPNGISDVELSTDHLECSPEGVGFVVTVYDQDKNPLSGASVLLTGLGVKQNGKLAVGTTGADGTFEFKGLTMDFPGKKGFLTVNVSKPEYGENNSTQILVVQP